MSINRARIVFRELVFVALLAGIVATPALARAQEEPATTAGEAFREALRLYGEADYAGARASFERAYSIQPNARVLANIADCLAHEGNVAQAVMTYRRFLAEAGEEVPAAARRLVERRLEDLRPQVCDLHVEAEPAGATILVDDVEVGTAPMPAPVAVAPGERRIEVRLEGYGGATRTVQARAGGDLDVSIVLSPVQQELQQTVGPSVVETPPPGRREAPRGAPLGRGPLLWVGVSATAALAIAGAITGTLALSQQSEYEDPGTSVARRREIYEGRNTFPLVTDILIDGAIVTGLLTAALFLFAGPDDDAEGTSTLTIAPRLVRGGGAACDLHFEL